MQSEHGCTVTITVNFSNSGGSNRPSILKPLDMGAAKNAAGGDKGPASPKGKGQANANKSTAEGGEEQDFSQWDLGRGKIQQKRENLQKWLTMLMEKNNSKLKKMHDRYCQQIKKRRNRPGGAQQEEEAMAYQQQMMAQAQAMH